MVVLAASVFASHRAAVDATYRELQVSADEALAIVEDALLESGRPGPVVDLLRVLEGNRLSPLFNRIRRTAGGSEIGFGVVGPSGELRANAPIFQRIDPPGDLIDLGGRRTTSRSGELVAIARDVVEVRGTEVTVVVALARDAPIVRLGDQGRGLVLLFIGILALAALGARVLSGQLADRLQPMAAASRRLAGGDMTARVPELGDPDLDAVGSAFNEMAEELAATREREREFIIGVGHDLRTPLTTIGGYAEALESGDVETSELARIGQVLGTQTRQLGRLIEDLSLLARLEQAEFGLRIETVDVGAHVTEVVEGFRRRADEIGVRLDVTASPGVILDTDPDRLAQIAQNLVENALRHTPEAGSVSVTVGEEGDDVVIAVADSGSGIAPEDLPNVFDRHYVGRQRSVRAEGSGLGLSIVKGLVERMGGTVAAESTPGRGTTITVRLMPQRRD
jgi:signal transduction histidine kinase